MLRNNLNQRNRQDQSSWLSGRSSDQSSSSLPNEEGQLQALMPVIIWRYTPELMGVDLNLRPDGRHVACPA
ncbi:hypothetical protein RRG08_011770 [Elysia crispata]|uniref:Uncharacterized protein n=1 Tax=Elysia crispata TaxID=231223 RepID=A0AAE0ZQV1_9GAST|nr:hypothetical protein RRG08_011770 [Elysia crispata]